MRPAHLACLVVLFGALGTPRAGAQAPEDEARRLMAEATAARERKDFTGLVATCRRMIELLPRSTRAVYNLAAAEALRGEGQAAVDLLERLARMEVFYDAAADPAFEALRETPAFRGVVSRLEGLKVASGESQVAFTLGEKDLITEGISHDPATGAFFVSSVRKRKILRIAKDGRNGDFVKAGQDGLFGALALQVDPGRRVLWASSAAVVGMEGLQEGDKGRSALFAFDLATGRLRSRLDPPVPGGSVGDLALGPTGRLFVSDPQNGRLYVLEGKPKAERLELLVDGGLASPQGLAPTPDGRTLYVADYLRGLARVDLATRRVHFLDAPADVAVTGVDGLVLRGDSLVGIQNGLAPHKVVRFQLDGSGSAIVGARTLARALPAFDEPTLGVVVGHELYYVGNSQWSKIGQDGGLDEGALQRPGILKLVLDW